MNAKKTQSRRYLIHADYYDKENYAEPNIDDYNLISHHEDDDVDDGRKLSCWSSSKIYHHLTVSVLEAFPSYSNAHTSVTHKYNVTKPSFFEHTAQFFKS